MVSRDKRCSLVCFYIKVGEDHTPYTTYKVTSTVSCLENISPLALGKKKNRETWD